MACNYVLEWLENQNIQAGLYLISLFPNTRNKFQFLIIMDYFLLILTQLKNNKTEISTSRRRIRLPKN